MAKDIRDLADEEVMQLVQGGNPRAFELVYDRHGGAAFSLAYRMVGNRVAAEDVVQEAFLSIWRSRMRYDSSRGSVRTWVLGIVHNRTIDALRRGATHERRQEALDGVEERHAYLLGALTDLERQAFERHVAGCAECRDELEQLRPAADALPRSVEQVEPPPGLKTSLMEVVESEARARSGAPAARRRKPRRLRLPSLGGFRPALVAAALALGLVAGFGVAQLGGGDDARTVAATVDQGRLPDASGSLRIQGDGENGAILSVQGMPPAGDEQVYQAWVERDGTVEP